MNPSDAMHIETPNGSLCGIVCWKKGKSKILKCFLFAPLKWYKNGFNKCASKEPKVTITVQESDICRKINNQHAENILAWLSWQA